MRVEKQAIIDEVSETVAGAEFVILTNCIGMTVAEMSALRGKLSERDSRLLVTKNTFIRIGAERAGKPGLEAWLEGPSDAVAQMIAWLREGPAWASVKHCKVTEQSPLGMSDFFVR